MYDLEIRRNQVDYVGLLAQPAFSLWGEGRVLMAALFAAYQPYGVALADFRYPGAIQTAADQEVLVRLPGGGTFRFRFDRVEASLVNYLEADLAKFPSMIDRGVTHLRDAASDFSIASHLLSHASHSVIPGVTSSEFFHGFRSQPDLRVGTSRGHGFIFHFDIQERSWRVQLTLDHSLSIPDGIFLNFNVLIASDFLNYEQTLTDARKLLSQCLESAGLRLPKADA